VAEPRAVRGISRCAQKRPRISVFFSEIELTLLFRAVSHDESLKIPARFAVRWGLLGLHALCTVAQVAEQTATGFHEASFDEPIVIQTSAFWFCDGHNGNMFAMAVAEQVHEYLAPSEVRSLSGRTDVVLATSDWNVEGHPVRDPRLF
jgi:hypothetical protein